MISLSLAPGYTGIAVAKTAPFMGLSPREQAIPSRVRRRPRWVLDIVLPRGELHDGRKSGGLRHGPGAPSPNLTCRRAGSTPQGRFVEGVMAVVASAIRLHYPDVEGRPPGRSMDLSIPYTFYPSALPHWIAWTLFFLAMLGGAAAGLARARARGLWRGLLHGLIAAVGLLAATMVASMIITFLLHDF